jgi:iron complex transport system permease protein
MVLADFTVQHVGPLENLPVGVVTAGVGGMYLGYLLITEWKRADA